MNLTAGMVLADDFELLRPLGEGGMGVVWLARERSLNRDVALKVMRPAENATRIRRFEREARALAALDHPCILPILRTGADSATGLHFFATQAVLLSPEEIRHLCDEVFRCPYPRSHAEGAEAPARWKSHAESAEGAEAPARWKSHAESAEGAEAPARWKSHAESAEGAEAPARWKSHAEGAEGAEAPARWESHAESAEGAEESLVTRRSSLVTAAATPPLPLSLAALLEGGKALPEAAVVRIARDLAGALAAAHAAGILHRDLKPSNILFEASGRALLADFGLAKFLEAQTESPDGRAPSRSERGPGAAEAPDSLSLDESGARKFLGSPAYAAPEQFREGVNLSPALDWYSFGAVLYEALTGERPRSLRAPSSFDPAHISRGWDALLVALLEPDPAKRLSDSAVILRALDRIARHPARHRRRPILGLLGISLLAIVVGAAALSRFHAAPRPAAVPDAENAGGEVPRPLQPPAPAVLSPPRLPSIWQGDDRGPLQLLNTFRQPSVDDVVDEAIAAADPETRRLLQEGDTAWTASPRDLVAANKAYHAAAVRLRDAMASAGGSGDDCPPSVVVCRAVALARLCWTYVANAAHGASDVPYGEALDAIAPLVESDPDRYAPLRSWLLAERAYMECMEDRFAEALGDLQEAGILWAGHVPVDAAYEAQVVILQASMGGMCRKVGDRSAALEMTTRAIVALEGGGGDAEGDSGDGRARPAGAPLRGSGSGSPPSFVNLLAGCHYRRAELLHDLGSRLESLQSYRRALDVWRGQFRRAGEPYRLTYAQVLGRVANACIDLKEYAEAIAAWEEMRALLRPFVDADPAQYGPVDAGIVENIDRASRALGDENRATAPHP